MKKEISKNNFNDLKVVLKKSLAKKNRKIAVLLAPSFVAEYNYPRIISELKCLGFDKVLELTFGAKMINREYHRILELEENKNKLVIASVCPGITSFIATKYPQYKENLIKVDSPMIATAKICKKIYPKHLICFIAPCNFKKSEGSSSKYVDFVIDYQELNQLLKENKKPVNKSENSRFDRFYNDYTKVYPLSGGLSKTAHLKQVLKPGEEKIIDGILDVEKFLKKPQPGVRFLDVIFCRGGCIGGPFVSNKNLKENKARVLEYMEIVKKEKMPEGSEGLIKKAKGIKFSP
jgi:iron only hydrogenase large subunit-like protein